MPPPIPSGPDETHDAKVERDFERRYGPRLRNTPDADGRFREPRSWLRKAGDEVSAWFGNPGALSRRQLDEASGDHRGEGPRAERSADDRILGEVSSRLAAHPDLDASGIEVRVKDSVVTLTGSTTISADRRLATDVAASAPGVTEVVDDLTIGKAAT